MTWEGDTSEDCKVWEHEDILIRRPKASREWTMESQQEDEYRLYFDGGCPGGIGSGGYLMYAPSGECIGGGARWYGKSAPTNNVAEASAVVDGLRYVSGCDVNINRLTVIGDSDLVINFMTRRYKPGKRELVLLMEQVRRW